MIIIIDTREKDLYITKILEQKNIAFKFKKLDFGDYSFELNGKSFEKEIVVERKASINEIIGNFTKGRKRFEAEFKRAKGCKVILMIEATEGDIEKHKYRSTMSPTKVKSFLKTWSYFFGLKLVFVDKVDSTNFILREFDDYVSKNKK